MSNASAPLPFTSETIAIGTELLIGGRSDSNSLVLADELGMLGIVVRFKSVVGDEQRDIVMAIQTAVKRSHVIVMTGGLGPTVDDCTREAVAYATGHRLSRRKEALEGLTARLAQWGRRPNEGQLRQGDDSIRRRCAEESGRFGAGVLPDMEERVDHLVARRAAGNGRDDAAGSRAVAAHSNGIVRTAFPIADRSSGVPYVWLAGGRRRCQIKGLIPKGASVDLGMLASPMGVLVSLTTKGNRSAPENNRDLLQKLANDVRSRLSEWLFAEGHDTMEEVVGRELAKRGLMLAVAESCTGGLIGHRLTQVAGSSAYVDRGAVCYSNRAKTEMLGVPVELIARQGAVSKEVAAAMACGIRERANVSVGLSVTGIAGPGGGTETKPVGLVYIGLDDGTGRPITREFRFHGDRNVIKQRSSQAALDLLRRWLLGKA